MKKKILIPIIIALIAAIGGGIYYYYYNYVETVTHYYLIRYTPAQIFNSPYGNSTIKPEVEISGLPEFISDSAAVANVIKDKERDLAWCEKELENVTKQNPTDNIKQIERNGKITALKRVLEEQWTTVSVTHTRNFDQSKINELVEIWNDPTKVEEFNNKYKLSVKLYPIEPDIL